MRSWLIAACLSALWLASAAAQETDLAVEDMSIVTRLDAYGQEIQVAEGFLVNTSETAFTNISLLAEVYDDQGEVIGEGFGYPVKACGEGLLDFTLNPGASQAFAVPLDIFNAEAEIRNVEILPQALSIEAAASRAAPFLMEGVTQVTAREVVAVEWIDPENLLYSAGCWRDLFFYRHWYEYNLRTGVQHPIEHPRAADITGQLRANIRLEDPLLFSRSFFSFAPGPNERRGVYQTALNTLVTVEPNGTFARVLYDNLANITLQGINWLPGGYFLAYYHGGYGDKVTYLTARVTGQQLSQHPNFSEPSLIVPGMSPNGQRVVIATTINDVTGYYIRATNSGFSEFLFRAEPPGNNWPAPIYHFTDDGQRFVYVARPVAGLPRLQCFNPDSDQMHDLTSLPLKLATDDRAWMWLSPDGQTIALAASGLDGGLWLIDLAKFEACA